MSTNTNTESIAIISQYPFPIGMAATNRIIAYSKGLINSGFNIDIFIQNPLRHVETLNDDSIAGQYSGINYKYTNGKRPNKYKIIRAVSILSGYRRLSGYYKTIRDIKIKHEKNQYHTLILSSDNIMDLFVYTNLCKTLSIQFVFIFDEYPIPIRHKLKSKIPAWKETLYKYVLQKVDVYVSISDQLASYYTNLRIKPTFILPVITDTTKFDNLIDTAINQIPQTKNEYICYMGNMELTKDNVDLIIKAFAILVPKHSDLELHLYGRPNDQTKLFLNDIIIDLKMEEKVFFKGRVSSDDVPQILKNAKVLVSSQPKTIRASGGFPTKLGEYLMSGKPSVFSDVGENAKYAKDKIHAYFVEPLNLEAYADTLNYILNNYQEALIVAEKGKKMIVENYSHDAMGKKLALFLKSGQDEK